jgi:hypothetical protein
MYLRGEISILVPAIFRTIVAILTAPAVNVEEKWMGIRIERGKTKGDEE